MPSLESIHLFEVQRRRQEYEDQLLASHGEDGYAKLLAKRSAAIAAFQELAVPLVDEARSLGFVHAQCSLDVGSRTVAMRIKLQFANDEGSYYERFIEVRKIADKHDVQLDSAESAIVASDLHVHVRNLDGMKTLRDGIRKKRIRVKL